MTLRKVRECRKPLDLSIEYEEGKVRTYKIPPRFEMEGVDPSTCPVELVHCIDGKMFTQVMQNIQVADSVVDLSNFCGPIAGKVKGQWALRFESREACKRLSQ